MHFFTVLEALTLASALSIDAFVASFAYGSRKIRLPFKSVQIINFICGGITGISLLAGSALRSYIPETATTVICFAVLFALGLVKLLDSTTKTIIRKYDDIHKEITFSLFNFKFILHLYANPEDADVDGSKVLSPAEAASLAVALSLDGVTVGLGAALGNVNGLAVFICSLAVGTAALLLGGLVGNRVAKKSPFNLSWLSGVILIILAVTKLF